MKKEYIKPIIIKICNNDALLENVSLFGINKVDSEEHIADEDADGPICDDYGTIWND